MSDSSTLLFILSGAVLLMVLAISIILFLVQYDRRQRIHALEKEALKYYFEKQLLQARLATQEQSFDYFSEEIHDNVGQILSAVGLKLFQLQELCNNEQAQALAQQSSSLIEKAIVDLRGMSQAFHGQYIDKAGLIEALRQEIVHINSTRSIDCGLNVTGEPIALGKDRETLLHNILKEAMRNALRHAKAKQISVTLLFEEGRLTAQVQDNGRGFDTGKPFSEKAISGLANMRLRAELLGSIITIESVAGTGTSITLHVPIHVPLQA